MKFLVTLLLALCASHVTLAADAKPTEAKPSAESVRQLFALMHTSNITENFMTQVQSALRGAMQQAVAGGKPNARQQKILDDMERKIITMVREQLDWKAVEPSLVEVYRNTFTQHEVDGLLDFYRSDVGRAAVTKLPQATQQSMSEVQGRMRSLNPKLTQLEKEAAAQIRAAGEPAGQAQPPPSGPSPPQPTQPQPPRSPDR